MMNRIKNFFHNPNMELRERIFRLILWIGITVIAIALVEGLFLKSAQAMMIALFVLLIVLGVSLFLTVRLKKLDAAIFIVGVAMICVVFPIEFLVSGAIEGGASVWFVLGFFYIFMMYSGRKMVAFTVTATAIDVFVYLVAYFKPEVVNPIGTQREIFLDSLFAVLVVGIAVGILLKYEIHQNNMERELAKRQAEELAVLGKSRSQFFASMSHEIRTPINTIIGLNEVILREDLPEDIVESAVNIQNAGKMLLALVNDILDLSQMENQKMEIVPAAYSTKALFGELVDMIRVRIKEKELDFVVNIDGSIPSRLCGDEKRIKQVILNLLANAVKYTEKGAITLTVHGDVTDDEQLRLTILVGDTGCGIRGEDLEQLFESFRRVDERVNNKIEGSGLGLSISKQLVDLMGGQITVDSIYTKGSNFTVILNQKIVDATPIGEVNYFVSNHESYRQHYKQSFEAPEARVLIVDDNEMNLMVAKKLLAPTKLQIDTASSGEECLACTRKKRYQVILMDHVMSGMDGVETLNAVRKQENGLCRKTPVIVLTANAMVGSEEIYRRYGFDSYLEKPIQGDKLEQEVLRYIPEELLEYQISRPTVYGKTGATDRYGNRMEGARRKKVCITADCVCDISNKLAADCGIRIMNLYITTAFGRFQDTKEINSNNLQQYVMRAKSQVFADSATVEEFEEFFAQMLLEAEDIIHISMAAKTGKTYDIARQAARGFGHVHVIDSGQISGGEALYALYASKLVEAGKGADEICAALEAFGSRVSTTFVLPSAHIFYTRGYINHVTTRIFERFNLHPVLHLSHSELKIFSFLTGNLERAWKLYIHLFFLNRRSRIDPRVVYVTHVGLSVRQLQMIEEEISKYVKFDHVIIEKACVSNACNSGIGTLGISCLRR